MTHYFIWKATNVLDDQVAEIEKNMWKGVSLCIEKNQQSSSNVRIEVTDGPFSLMGEVTTSDGKTIVLFTYSLLQSGHHQYKYYGVEA